MIKNSSLLSSYIQLTTQSLTTQSLKEEKWRQRASGVSKKKAIRILLEIIQII